MRSRLALVGAVALERISLEVTNRCAKGCSFCYASSKPDGPTSWTADDIVALATDCALHGVRALSLGGGEPLQALSTTLSVLQRLRGVLFRSLTTNGLLLDGDAGAALVDARPDKVHISIHAPDDDDEVARVIRQLHQLTLAGLRTGANLVVDRAKLAPARLAVERLRAAGLTSERIVVLPMRGGDGSSTPTPRELAWVALDERFQSMSCLKECGASPRFCSITWDRRAGWCSYTTSKRALAELTYAGVTRALAGLDVEPCGGAPPRRRGRARSRVAVASGRVDYPAAHSIDTDWFGVDDDGHVAFFHSGEEGAVPWDASSMDDTRHALALLCAPYGPELWGLVANGEENVERHDALWQIGGGYVVFTRFLDVPRHFAREIANGSVRVLSAFPNVDALFIRPADDVELMVKLGFLHDVDACAGCFDTEHFSDMLVTTRPHLMSSFGLFVYEMHAYDPHVDYRREAAPRSTPLLAPQLPADVRARFIRLRTHFVGDIDLHPADHVDCRTYRGDDLGPGWRTR